MSKEEGRRPDITLEPVSRHNVRSICELELAENQLGFIAPAAYTVAEAHYEPSALLRAICLDGQPVGVALIELTQQTPRVVRFMIDEIHQRLGVGLAAFELLRQELEAQGFSSLEVTCHASNTGALEFWSRCGLSESGATAHGEILLRLA